MQITRVDCPLDKFDMACKLLELVLRTFLFQLRIYYYLAWFC